MEKIKPCILLISLTFLLCGCSNKIMEPNEQTIIEKTSSEITEEQSQLSKEVQEKKSDLTEPIFQGTDILNITNDTDYEIYFDKFIVKNEDKQTDIIIEYPQIKNMKSPDIQKKVNKLLSEKATSNYRGEDVDGLSLSMKAKVEYANENIISVKYTGFAYYSGAVNGYDIMYATNVNLKTGEIIDIHDLFTDSFKQKLNRNVFKYNGADKVGDGETLDPNSIEYGYINADEGIIKEMFENYYCNMDIDNYYFSDKYFNIIVKTPSGPIIYLELAASYEKLEDCMNFKDRLWDDILILK